MKDYDVYELKTEEELDAAFARTFGLPDTLDWAQSYNQAAATDFLEGMTKPRRIQFWKLTLRNWNRGNGADYMAEVSSVHSRGGQKSGVKGSGFSNFGCHALMKAAIEWDQRRREQLRGKRS